MQQGSLWLVAVKQFLEAGQQYLALRVQLFTRAVLIRQFQLVLQTLPSAL